MGTESKSSRNLEPSSLTPPSPTQEFSSEANLQILTVLDVARELRCSKAHIYNVINGNVRGVSPLPAIPAGRRRLVRRSSLEAWKRANERTAAGVMIDPSQKNHDVDA